MGGSSRTAAPRSFMAPVSSLLAGQRAALRAVVHLDHGVVESGLRAVRYLALTRVAVAVFVFGARVDELAPVVDALDGGVVFWMGEQQRTAAAVVQPDGRIAVDAGDAVHRLEGAGEVAPDALDGERVHDGTAYTATYRSSSGYSC